MRKRYVLGNILRGYVEGRFASKEKAFSVLYARFHLSYPVSTTIGRFVQLFVEEVNQYGIEELIQCDERNATIDRYSPTYLKRFKFTRLLI